MGVTFFQQRVITLFCWVIVGGYFTRLGLSVDLRIEVRGYAEKEVFGRFC